MTSLPGKIVAVHRAFAAADIAHAFGGALALAWCTGRARGTIDIDVNVFVEVTQSEQVFDALPPQVRRSAEDLERVRREGQVRLWWEHTPMDVFLNTTDFHVQAATRTRWETFMGQDVPFLACHDLAVFKAFFNRTRDWADLEEMHSAGTLDIDRVSGVLVHYLGADDERVAALAAMLTAPGGP